MGLPKSASRPLAADKSPQLLRQLGVVSAAALVVSNMVGTGIFTATGFLAGDLARADLIILIWVVGAICALAGAFCYSELGVNFPSSGGEYVYLTRAYGPTWGFMTGWASFFAGFSAPIAAASLAFSDYVGYFFPALKQQSVIAIFGPIRLGGAQLAASSLILVLTILNCIGIQRVARVQNALTGLKVLIITAFIVLGFLAGTGDWSHFSQSAERTSTTPLAAQFAISLFFIYVSYSGWNAATYVAEEIKQPARTLPLALTWGTLLVAALFILLNIVFIYGTPLERMKGVIAVGSLTASDLFGANIAGAFSGLMALSLISTVNAMVTIGPRVYYAMARNGAFLSAAASVHPKWRTPVVAIVCQGICSILMTLTPFPQLVLFIGFTLNFFAVMAVASIFIFRRRPDWQRLKVVSFAWPLVPALFIVVGIWMTIYGMMLQPRVSLIAVVIIAIGAALYRLRLRRSPPPLTSEAH